MSHSFLQKKRKQEKTLNVHSDSSLIEEPSSPKEEYDFNEKNIHLSKKITSERSWDLDTDDNEIFLIENPEINATKPFSKKVFEKRKRHKTSESRYDTEKKKKIRHKSNCNDSKELKSTRWQPQKKVPGDIIRKFKSKKIGQSRITLQMSYSRGLFKNGRASSLVGSRGIPDLSFSEMEFLRNSKKTIQVDSENSPVKTKHLNKNFPEINEKDDEISAFFKSSINSQPVVITPELKSSPKEILETKCKVMSSPRSKKISSNCDVKNNTLLAENRQGPTDRVHKSVRELSLDNRSIIGAEDRFHTTTLSKELSLNTLETDSSAIIPVGQSANSVQKIKSYQTLVTETGKASVSEMVDSLHKTSSKIGKSSYSQRIDPDYESDNITRDHKTIQILPEKSLWMYDLEYQTNLDRKKDQVILDHYADQKTSSRPHNYTGKPSSVENHIELSQINRPATTLPVMRVSLTKAVPAKDMNDPCVQNLESKVSVKNFSQLHETYGENEKESRLSCTPKENHRTPHRLKKNSNLEFYDSDYENYRAISSIKSNEGINFSSACGECEKRCEKNQNLIQKLVDVHNNRPNPASSRDYNEKIQNQTIESWPSSPIDVSSSSFLAVKKKEHEEKYCFLSQVDRFRDSNQRFFCEDFDAFNSDIGLNDKLFSVKNTGKSTTDYKTYDTNDQKLDQYINLDDDQSISSNSDLAQHGQSNCTYFESNTSNTILHDKTVGNFVGLKSHETCQKKKTSNDTQAYLSRQKSAGLEDLSYLRRSPEDLKEIEGFWCVHRQY